MNKIKDFFDGPGNHDLRVAVAVLVGLMLLFLVFRTGKTFAKVIAVLAAVGLVATAWWWHNPH